MKLELGAGESPAYGYVHHDARELPDIEIVCDVREIKLHVVPGNVETIRAAHLLEHFSHLDTVDILKEWHELLMADGTLHVEVPNLTWQAQALANGQPDPSGRLYSDEDIVELIFGAQDYEGNFHRTGFTAQTLQRALELAGFSSVISDIGQVLVGTARKESA